VSLDIIVAPLFKVKSSLQQQQQQQQQQEEEGEGEYCVQIFCFIFSLFQVFVVVFVVV